MNKKTQSIEKITRYKTPEESPGYLLWRVSTAWRSSIEDALKVHDLTHPQFVVLATTAWLTRTDSHISQIDISKATELDPNTISQIIRGLEAKQLIERTRSLNERSKSPRLTPLGKQKLKEALPVVEKADELFFEHLENTQKQILILCFNKLLRC